MKYRDFYHIAKYANENWKGNFSEEDIACYAYDYLCEFEYSKRTGKATDVMKILCQNLKEDADNGDMVAKFWLATISKEIVLA